MSRNRLAKVYHADLWGTRVPKYAWPNDHDLKHTDWVKLKPGSPFYLFVPRNEALEASYDAFVPVPEVFPVNSVGIVYSN